MKNAFSVARARGASFSQAVKKFAAVGSVAVLGFAANNPVYAIDTADIEAAQTAGTSAVTLVVAGLIGMVAIIVGVNLVISMMKKG